jgi:hypothetical protein
LSPIDNAASNLLAFNRVWLSFAFDAECQLNHSGAALKRRPLSCYLLSDFLTLKLAAVIRHSDSLFGHGALNASGSKNRCASGMHAPVPFLLSKSRARKPEVAASKHI